jgi:hypothetical protein
MPYCGFGGAVGHVGPAIMPIIEETLITEPPPDFLKYGRDISRRRRAFWSTARTASKSSEVRFSVGLAAAGYTGIVHQDVQFLILAKISPKTLPRPFFPGNIQMPVRASPPAAQ